MSEYEWRFHDSAGLRLSWALYVSKCVLLPRHRAAGMTVGVCVYTL